MTRIGAPLRSSTVSFPLLMLTALGGTLIDISMTKGLNTSRVLFYAAGTSFTFQLLSKSAL